MFNFKIASLALFMLSIGGSVIAAPLIVDTPYDRVTVMLLDLVDSCALLNV